MDLKKYFTIKKETETLTDKIEEKILNHLYQNNPEYTEKDVGIVYDLENQLLILNIYDQISVTLEQLCSLRNELNAHITVTLSNITSLKITLKPKGGI